MAGAIDLKDQIKQFILDNPDKFPKEFTSGEDVLKWMKNSVNQQAANLAGELQPTSYREGVNSDGWASMMEDIKRTARDVYQQQQQKTEAANTATEKAKQDARDQQKLDFNSSVNQEVAKRTQSDLAQRLNDMYKGISDETVQQLNDYYAPIRARTIAEQAASGRLDSPVSSYNLNANDVAQQNAIAAALSGIKQQQANQQSTLATNLENLLSNQNQFSQEMGLKNKTLDQQIAEFNKNYDLGLKKLQTDIDLNTDRNLTNTALYNQMIENSGPSTWDKIDRGVTTANNFLTLGSALKGYGNNAGNSSGSSSKKPTYTSSNYSNVG